MVASAPGSALSARKGCVSTRTASSIAGVPVRLRSVNVVSRASPAASWSSAVSSAASWIGGSTMLAQVVAAVGAGLGAGVGLAPAVLVDVGAGAEPGAEPAAVALAAATADGLPRSSVVPVGAGVEIEPDGLAPGWAEASTATSRTAPIPAAAVTTRRGGGSSRARRDGIAIVDLRICVDRAPRRADSTT